MPKVPQVRTLFLRFEQFTVVSDAVQTMSCSGRGKRLSLAAELSVRRTLVEGCDEALVA